MGQRTTLIIAGVLEHFRRLAKEGSITEGRTVALGIHVEDVTPTLDAIPSHHLPTPTVSRDPSRSSTVIRPIRTGGYESTTGGIDGMVFVATI